MADNLKYNEPGSGPLVATDDVGSTHYQVMKLNLGADGISVPIDGKIPVTIVSGVGVVLAAGTDNIGDVDIASLPNEGQQTMTNSISVAVASDQSAIPVSSTNLDIRDLASGSDSVLAVQGEGSAILTSAWAVSGTLNINGTMSTAVVKFVRVNATSDGDNTVISGVTNKKIRVLGYALTVTTAGTITLQDTAGTPNIFGQFSLVAQGGVSYAGGLMCPAFETLAGNGVEINVAAGQDCLGHLCYQEV